MDGVNKRKMTSMNDKYGDGSNHEVCLICGLCIDCKDCICISNKV